MAKTFLCKQTLIHLSTLVNVYSRVPNITVVPKKSVRGNLVLKFLKTVGDLQQNVVNKDK